MKKYPSLNTCIFKLTLSGVKNEMGLFAYWKLDDSGHLYLSDSTDTPFDIKIREPINKNLMWRYLDEPFPGLAYYDQSRTKNFEGSSLEFIKFTRVLATEGPITLIDFSIRCKYTLEFWVLLPLTS